MMDDSAGIFYRATESTARADYSSYKRPWEPQPDEIQYLGEAVRFVTSGRLAQVINLKRIFDILFASIALVVLSPVILIAAVLLKIESRGPVFFTQERIGLNRRRLDRRSAFNKVEVNKRSGGDRRKNTHAGRPFKIFKLRTMREDAEKSGPALASIDDPRITRVGRIMRKSRIDEIPQFINVIKGDMSIVGPRPERSFFINMIKQEVPDFPLRLVVKPGITGLAQVEDGYAQTLDRMRNKLFFDLKYISEISVFQEIKILFKTFFVILTGKGAC